MPRSVLALDTSAAIFLDHLQYLEQLHQLTDMVLAPAVVRELRAAPGKPGSGVSDLPWIEVRTPEPAQCDEVRRGLDAHAGEVETLALALDGSVVPVIDERPATRYAVGRRLPVVSTLALLVDLHRRGMAARPIEDDLALLTGVGMYLTEDLVAATIEQLQSPKSPDWPQDMLGP